MLRRDFLKFLGIAGAGAAIPRTGLGSETLSNLTHDSTDAPVNPENSITLTFEFYDITSINPARETVIVSAQEGHFEYREHLEAIAAYDFDFYLNLALDWCSDSDFYYKIRDYKGFDLLINLGNQQYQLRECVWHSLEVDMREGLFSVVGKMSAIT